MKQIILSLMLVLSIQTALSQSPNAINYQAVARNSGGAILANQNVGLQFSIFDGSPSGTNVYTERHTVSTNVLGLFTLQIGQGTVQSGNFTTINWGTGAKFLKMELDPAGGTSYINLGTNQIVSVPYALFANSATSANTLSGSATISPSQITAGGASSNQILQWNGSNWVPATINTSISTNATLDGNGTGGNPLKIAQNGASTGQVLKWNGTTWAPVNLDATVSTDNTMAGNGSSGTPLKLAQNGATSNQLLKWNGTAWTPSSLDNTILIPGTGLSMTGSTINSAWTLSGSNLSNNTGNSLQLMTNSKPRVYVDGDGNMGIGKTSNGANLYMKHGTKSMFDSLFYAPSFHGLYILSDSMMNSTTASPKISVGQRTVVKRNKIANVGGIFEVGSNTADTVTNYGLISIAPGVAKNGFNFGGYFIAQNATNNVGAQIIAGNTNDSLNGGNTALYTSAQGIAASNTGISNSMYGTTYNQRNTGISNQISSYGRYSNNYGYYNYYYTDNVATYTYGEYSQLRSDGDSAVNYGSQLNLNAYGNNNANYGNSVNITSDGDYDYNNGNRASLYSYGDQSTNYGNSLYLQSSGPGSSSYGADYDVRSYAKSTYINGVNIYAQGSNNNDDVYALRVTGFNGGNTNYAGYFNGDVHVNGTLSKSGGSFKIDHPSDPENKYLTHSFVESPDMMNIYNGNIFTDEKGEAIVTLPDYFETLNTDFRYQLTCIGVFAQAIVTQKIEGNTFKIATDQPNVEVSWMVTGVRQDAWAKANPIIPVTDKKPSEKGTYLNPEVYGQPIERQLGYQKQQEHVAPAVVEKPKAQTTSKLPIKLN